MNRIGKRISRIISAIAFALTLSTAVIIPDAYAITESHAAEVTRILTRVILRYGFTFNESERRAKIIVQRLQSHPGEMCGHQLGNFVRSGPFNQSITINHINAAESVREYDQMCDKEEAFRQKHFSKKAK
jgi:hypothetical protein